MIFLIVAPGSPLLTGWSIFRKLINMPFLKKREEKIEGGQTCFSTTEKLLQATVSPLNLQHPPFRHSTCLGQSNFENLDITVNHR